MRKLYFGNKNGASYKQATQSRVSIVLFQQKSMIIGKTFILNYTQIKLLV